MPTTPFPFQHLRRLTIQLFTTIVAGVKALLTPRVADSQTQRPRDPETQQHPPPGAPTATMPAMVRPPDDFSLYFVPRYKGIVWTRSRPALRVHVAAQSHLVLGVLEWASEGAC
jgi:hypothetical protein